MDSDSPLDANGRPYVFRSFTGRGVVDDPGDPFDGNPVKIADRLSGAHANELPLNNQVVSFD